MSFIGLKKAEDRINVIAYLHAQGGTLPIPAPNPAATAAPAPEGASPAPGAAETGKPATAAAPPPATPPQAAPAAK